METKLAFEQVLKSTPTPKKKREPIALLGALEEDEESLVEEEESDIEVPSVVGLSQVNDRTSNKQTKTTVEDVVKFLEEHEEHQKDLFEFVKKQTGLHEKDVQNTPTPIVYPTIDLASLVVKEERKSSRKILYMTLFAIVVAIVGVWSCMATKSSFPR